MGSESPWRQCNFMGRFSLSCSFLLASLSLSSGIFFAPMAIAEESPGFIDPFYENIAPPPPNLEQNYSLENETRRVTSLLENWNGDLWVGSWQGLSRINPNTGEILKRIDLTNYNVEALAMDRVGRICIYGIGDLGLFPFHGRP